MFMSKNVVNINVASFFSHHQGYFICFLRCFCPKLLVLGGRESGASNLSTYRGNYIADLAWEQCGILEEEQKCVAGNTLLNLLRSDSE